MKKAVVLLVIIGPANALTLLHHLATATAKPPPKPSTRFAAPSPRFHAAYSDGCAVANGAPWNCRLKKAEGIHASITAICRKPAVKRLGRRRRHAHRRLCPVPPSITRDEHKRRLVAER